MKNLMPNHMGALATLSIIVELKNKNNADKGMVVTGSTFTDMAVRCSSKSNIELWDGKKLRKMLR